MKVKELIEKLKELPQNKDVITLNEHLQWQINCVNVYDLEKENVVYIMFNGVRDIK